MGVSCITKIYIMTFVLKSKEGMNTHTRKIKFKSRRNSYVSQYVLTILMKINSQEAAMITNKLDSRDRRRGFVVMLSTKNFLIHGMLNDNEHVHYSRHGQSNARQLTKKPQLKAQEH
jgi:hypothetical protein